MGGPLGLSLWVWLQLLARMGTVPWLGVHGRAQSGTSWVGWHPTPNTYKKYSPLFANISASSLRNFKALTHSELCVVNEV